MTAKVQPWLISCTYTPVFARDDLGGTFRGTTTQIIMLIDEPPWKFLANQKKRQREAYMGRPPFPKEGTRLPDEIHAIYWAVQLPIGALDEEEMDLLS